MAAPCEQQIFEAAGSHAVTEQSDGFVLEKGTGPTKALKYAAENIVREALDHRRLAIAPRRWRLARRMNECNESWACFFEPLACGEVSLQKCQF